MLKRLPAHGRKPMDRGQALVEFALVAVVFFMLVFGILDGARLFQSWVTVQHAAREGARYAITGQVSCDGETDNRNNCIAITARGATTGIFGGGPSGDDVTVSWVYWDYPDYSGDGTLGSGDECDSIEVRVEYTHHFVSPILEALVPGGIHLTGSQRMVNEPFGTCVENDGSTG